MSNFIEIHIIHVLQAANPNRGEDGGVKSIHYGGYDRARLSSQAQKKAARGYYCQNAKLRPELGKRSRRHWVNLAPKLTEWADEGDRAIVAKLVLGLFNFGPEKLIPSLLEDEGNLIFLADCEIDTLAELIHQNKELLDEWLERGKDFISLVDQREKKEIEAKTKTLGKDPSSAELEKIRNSVVAQVKKEYDRQLTDKNTKKIRNDVVGGLRGPISKKDRKIGEIIRDIDNAIPGDVAFSGRLMTALVETSVDGCVQVAHALGLTALPRVRGNEGYASGSIDFFAACDDIKPIENGNGGAGMIGETRFTAPTYYRCANVNVTEFLRLIGAKGKELAPEMISTFIEGFVTVLPEGYVRSFAHQTMPVFVLIQVTPKMPLQYSPPFEKVLVEPVGEKSISEMAVQKLIDWRKEICQLYDKKDSPYYTYSAVTALSSHYAGDIVPLEKAIAGAIEAAIR